MEDLRTHGPWAPAIGRSISGRNMPLLPTSTHFLSMGWYAKISMDGSVYGLNAGLKRNLVMPTGRVGRVYS